MAHDNLSGGSAGLSGSTASLASRLATSQGLASDSRSLDKLRRSAGQDPKGAAREAAKQFESLFTAQLLKTAREGSEGGLMDNDASRLGTQMLDDQLCSKLAGRAGGLAEVIARQLERQMGITPGPIPSTGTANSALPTVITPANQPRVPGNSAAGFVQQHTPAARAAESETGIPAAFMLAQAAHETGWGRKEIIGMDGSNSHNLFGIKAGGSWKGPTVDVQTTEYINGTPRKMVQKFRAYGNEAESFADYARLMKDSPRYAAVVANSGNAQAFAQGLQKAGYATDPAYADKLGRVINTTLRLQKSLA